MAIAQFSDDARTEFQLNSYSDKERLLDAINKITYKGGNTKTGEALVREGGGDRGEGLERQQQRGVDHKQPEGPFEQQESDPRFWRQGGAQPCDCTPKPTQVCLECPILTRPRGKLLDSRLGNRIGSGRTSGFREV